MKKSRLIVVDARLRKGWRNKFTDAGYDVISIHPKWEEPFKRVMKRLRLEYDHITFVGQKPFLGERLYFDAAIYISGRMIHSITLTSQDDIEALQVTTFSLEKMFLEVWAWLTERFFPDDLTIDSGIKGRYL